MPKRIEINTLQLTHILEDVEKGLLKIPRFQREVVWDLNDSVKLLDSVYRGFPIGCFVIWQTSEKLSDVRSIGNLSLPEPPANQLPSYVLDGQQRVTSVFACAKEVEVRHKNRKTPVKYVAWFDLDLKEFTNDKPANGVTFAQLIANNYDKYRDHLSEAHKEVFSEARRRLTEEYKFAGVTVLGCEIEEACEIFERINNSGKKLTIFDLLVAKAYAVDFDLRESWRKVAKELAVFSGINPILPMQALSLLTVKLDPDRTGSSSGKEKFGCHKRHLLKIPPEDIKVCWKELQDSIRLAIDFLRTRIGVPTLKLVPYEAPIALLTLFFMLNKRNGPTELQAEHLAQYFWASCTTARYAGSPESTMEEDALAIREIAAGKSVSWSWAKGITAEEILDARYDRRDARVQTILCLLASKKPLSFKSCTEIPVATQFSEFNATELHHVFPRGWLKKADKAFLAREHSLANICLAPSREQRHEIGFKPPGEYLAMFKATNPRLGDCLKNHFMDGEIEPLLMSNSFESFLEHRAEALARALNAKAGVTT
ncbi:MAG: DUF262 domain-containing protein [Verrucomicrobiota bacterium]|jgi:hypothetical protein